MNKQIGLFCGTFNPIHNAHLLLAQCACDQFNLEQIYFVTSPRPPHRQDTLLPGELRHKMVLLAIAGNKKFVSSSVELERTGPSYTIDTIKYFAKDNVKINLLLGGDNVIQLPTWKNFDEIISLTKLLIAPRWSDHVGTRVNAPVNNESFSLEEQKILHKTDHAFIDFPLIDISSTYIRHCLKEGKSIRYLVPEPVYELIEKEKILR